MPRPVSDQVVVITGASSGIGRTTARMFAERGAKVVATGRSEDDLSGLVDEITAAGGTAVDVVGDVTDEEAMHRVARTAVERFGRLDTWVGNAGTSVYGRAWDIPTHEYDAVMRTNWLGQVYGAMAALPYLRESGGTLVCIGSVESVRAVPLHAPYVASKMALRGFCDALRMDLEEENAGVAVSLIMPAAIDTPFFEHSASYADSDPKPPQPVYAPESVAQAILRMAEHPQRQVAVGGAAFGFLTGEKLAPRLTDKLMTARHAMARAQQTDRPAAGTGNLHAPQDGTGRERGGHGGRTSLAAAVTTARPVVRRAATVGATAAGLAATRLAARGMEIARRRASERAAGRPSDAPSPQPRVIELPDASARTSPGEPESHQR